MVKTTTPSRLYSPLASNVRLTVWGFVEAGPFVMSGWTQSGLEEIIQSRVDVNVTVLVDSVAGSSISVTPSIEIDAGPRFSSSSHEARVKTAAAAATRRCLSFIMLVYLVIV